MITEYLYLGFGLQIIATLIFVIVNNSGMWHDKYNMPSGRTARKSLFLKLLFIE